jgi:hypothetical protein
MKPIHLRTPLLARADLFGSAASLPSLTNLQLHQLVDLLSQLAVAIGKGCRRSSTPGG